MKTSYKAVYLFIGKRFGNFVDDIVRTAVRTAVEDDKSFFCLKNKTLLV